MDEYVKPVFVHEQLQPEHHNHRVDINGLRWYVRLYPDNTTQMAPSWTTVKTKCSPTDAGLMQWFKENNSQKTNFISENSANYGTFFHVMCGRYLMGEPIKLNEGWLMLEMEAFFVQEDYNFVTCKKWMRQEKRDLRKDLYGFAVFCKEWKVEPLAIEYPVMNKDGLYAATLDIVAYMTDPKTECKFIGLIDIKSTTKGVDRVDNELQLVAQWLEWNQEWPDYPVSRIFNYGCHNYRLPLSSRVTPYKLKDQSQAPNAYKWPLWLQEFHGDHKNIPGQYKTDFKDNLEIQLFSNNEDVFDTYDVMGRVKDYHIKEVF